MYEETACWTGKPDRPPRIDTTGAVLETFSEEDRRLNSWKNEWADPYANHQPIPVVEKTPTATERVLAQNEKVIRADNVLAAERWEINKVLFDKNMASEAARRAAMDVTLEKTKPKGCWTLQYWLNSESENDENERAYGALVKKEMIWRETFDFKSKRAKAYFKNRETYAADWKKAKAEVAQEYAKVTNPSNLDEVKARNPRLLELRVDVVNVPKTSAYDVVLSKGLAASDHLTAWPISKQILACNNDLYSFWWYVLEGRARRVSKPTTTNDWYDFPHYILTGSPNHYFGVRKFTPHKYVQRNFGCRPYEPTWANPNPSEVARIKNEYLKKELRKYIDERPESIWQLVKHWKNDPTLRDNAEYVKAWEKSRPTKKDGSCKLQSVFEKAPEIIDFNTFFSWLYILQFVFFGVFLLFIVIYFPKNSKATMVLNILISITMVYTLVDSKLGTVVRLQEKNNNILEDIHTNQENPLYFNLFFFYAILIIFLFFFGVIDRFFIANSGEMEFSVLICFIVVGSLLLFKVHNFLDVILSLEVITLASYVLVSFDKKNRFSTYAGVQYFVLGSLPSGMLVLGSAMLYENWGTLVIEDLDVLLSNIYILNFEDSIFDVYNSFTNFISNTFVLYSGVNNLYLDDIDKDLFLNHEEFLYLKSKNNILTFATIIGFCLILFNFLFKITSAPFHVWAPSIYGKAPIVTVTFLSIFSKAMVFF